MKYGSVCSGIEAATVAWHPLGWEPSFFSEIDAFPRSVLQHRFPDVPLHGDFTTIGESDYDPVDLLVGGTPCQSFSVAGLRKGLGDDRGNLALEFIRLAQRLRPKWVVWENVPGVLSSNGGRDFGAFLGGLVELGYGFAYRVLDAQYFGVPQRRRRVFVVGHIGDWRRAAAVLFERNSLSGNTAPSREKGEVAPTTPPRSTGGGGLGADFDCDGGLELWPAKVEPTLNAAFGSKMGLEDQHALGGEGLFVLGAICAPETAAVAVQENQRGETRLNGTMGALSSGGGKPGQGYPAVAIRTASAKHNMSLRRLTPRECERLQGFPDDWTAVPYRNKPADQCPDGPRYKAIGNSMAVPVMAWIGRRIVMQKSG